MAFFENKDIESNAYSKTNTAKEQVALMRDHGYTDNQIMQTLQSQGLNSEQAVAAMNTVNADAAIPVDPNMNAFGQQGFDPNAFSQAAPQQQSMPSELTGASSVGEERIQEIAEAIIEEKWNDLVKDIKKVIDWKEQTEDRVAKIEQEIEDVKVQIETLTKGISSKINSYDTHITNVGTEIKAMEKVFQKVLPNLTENVNKLDRIAKGYKKV